MHSREERRLDARRLEERGVCTGWGGGAGGNGGADAHLPPTRMALPLLLRTLDDL